MITKKQSTTRIAAECRVEEKTFLEDPASGRGRRCKPSVKCQSTGAGEVQVETSGRETKHLEAEGDAEAGVEEPQCQGRGGGAEPDPWHQPLPGNWARNLYFL